MAKKRNKIHMQKKKERKKERPLGTRPFYPSLSVSTALDLSLLALSLSLSLSLSLLQN